MDGSASSIAALRWAVHYAELADGSVDAVIAWHFPVASYGIGFTLVAAPDDADYSEPAAKMLSEALAEVSPPPGVPVREHVVQGYPDLVLLDLAKGADLLVVGNRGHGEFTEALIGSVSRRCVHHAHCPVVVAHADDLH